MKVSVRVYFPHMARIRVGVLRGGPSSEYDVSLKTGASVLEHLGEDKYQPIDMLVDKSGQWHVNGFPFEEANAARQMDVIVNALHGRYGEDGTVQRILDTVGVPYTGSDSLASAVAFNKALTKHTLYGSDIKMAPHIAVELDPNVEQKLLRVFRSFSFPAVVKPVADGSSVGVSVASTFDELLDAAEKAGTLSPKILIEEYIKGREATCGVVEGFRGEELYAFFPTEIIPATTSRFFDYDAKYGGDSQEICPGNFMPEEKREIQRMAKLAHQRLGLRHYSRSDFIVSPRGIYFLEVNTLPGLTSESLLPKAIKAAGSSLHHFLDHLIQLAMRKA